LRISSGSIRPWNGRAHRDGADAAAGGTARLPVGREARGVADRHGARLRAGGFLRDQYDRVENLREAVAFLASATFRGFAHVEKHYAEGGRGIVRLEPVEQWFWCRSGMFGE